MSRNRGEGLEVFIEDNQKSMELTSSNKPISIKLPNYRVIRAYINKNKELDSVNVLCCLQVQTTGLRLVFLRLSYTI